MAEARHEFTGFEDGRPPAGQKAPDAFRTISEVSVDLDIPQHVLRFWEGKFTQIKPLKRGGGRRYYRPEDVELLRGIQHLLYADGYTIKGVQKILREHGVKFVAAAGRRRIEPSDKAKPGPRLAPPAIVATPTPVAAPEEAITHEVTAATGTPDTIPPPSRDRLLAASQLLGRLKAMRREYDLKLQAAKNGRAPT